ncbi:hypothetical protein J2X16_003616 [Pelomonas aquatica]|uniref:Apea-like HEPN domain-containing protein n=1 Tax=Pelomonas aquatica TaxID=431058 RepID=A0ABU1ZCS3_9BURK|nr:hypothetical protein [Pelomonas aquatica]MDR7298253.1 hypothetical protein [Pelomonas aquatica]
MAKLIDILNALVRELDETHGPDGLVTRIDGYLPNFVMTRSGVERHFSKAAQTEVAALAGRLFNDRVTYREAMRVTELAQLLRSCIADLHADGLFATTPAEEKAHLKLLNRELEERLKGMTLPFGHGFPATTLRLEDKGPYQVGPVDIRSVRAWLETVTLSDWEYKHHGIAPDSNWKAELLDILSATTRLSRPEVPAHLQTFADALHNCDAVVSVAVLGLEQSYSREIARMVARTAIDGISLLSSRGRNAFSQQALSDERLQPLRLNSMVVFKGEQWVGGQWSDRAIPSPPAGLSERVFQNGKLHTSLCDVVGSLLDGRSHTHPKLAMRWAAALDWYAEGCRETSTSVAVTKLAAALDVLTCGRTEYGITQMLANLLGRAATESVFQGVPDSLKHIVDAIYGGGRSQLLHGSKVDRRVAFDSERSQAQALGHLALVSLLKRLASYTGPDEDIAFITMPP